MDLESKIIKQLEYYFSDVNLAKDKYMRDLIEKSEDGWISMEEMLKFPRLKNLSEKSEDITNAVKNSSPIDFQFDENKGFKRTSTDAVPTDMHEVSTKYMNQSVYVKGFKSSETMDEIMTYLENCGGPTMNVFMRRVPRDKKFKGSVFAIFKTEADTEKFLTNEESKTFKESPMMIMKQQEYHDQKNAEYKNKAEEKEKREKQAAAAKEEMIMNRMTKGALLEFEGLAKSDDENTDVKTITNELKTWLTEKCKELEADIAWVDCFPTTGKAIVRLTKENAAEKAKVILCGEEKDNFEYSETALTVSVLSGDAEKNYWKTVFASQDNKKNNKRHNRNGGPPSKRRRN